ncbi:hypothetical protein Tco_1282298 [Tanacetum coccineum]
MPATPSPRSVCTILQDKWCKVVVLSVSSPNESKSRGLDDLEIVTHATTKNKGKEIVKPPPPPSDSAFEEDRTSTDLPTTTLELRQTLRTRMWTLLQELGMTDKLGSLGMAKIQEVLHATDDNLRPTYDAETLEKVDINVIPDSLDICDNEGKADQNTDELEDEHVLVSSLIANLKLDVDENQKIQMQLKKANTSLTQEPNKYKLDLKYCKIDLERQIAKIANEKEQLKNNFKEREDKDIDKQIAMENQVKTLIPQESSMGKPCLYKVKYDKNDLANMFAPVSEETIRLAEESRSKLVAHNAVKNVVLFENALKEEMLEDLKYVKSVKEVDDLKMKIVDLKSQLKKNAKTDFPKIDNLLLQEFLKKYILETHRTSVSRPHLRSTQMKEKVVPNNSQVILKKKEVKDHHRISSFSNKKSEMHYINDVNAITKKPKVVHISTRKPTKNVNQSVATPHKITVASETIIHKSESYFRMIYEKTSKAWTWWIEKQCPSGYIWKPKVKHDNALASDILPLDIASRSTTNSEPFNKMGSYLPNSLPSSKCFANHTNHPIHQRYLMHKAHDEKPQVAV